MRIRGHHLICLLHFEGKGYSEEFVKNMYRILNELKKGTLFRLVLGEDDICEFCPHNERGRCALGEEEVISKDRKVIEDLSLNENEKYSFTDIKTKIYSCITLDKFWDICGRCRWFDICLKNCTFRI